MNITEDIHVHTYLSDCAKDTAIARDYVANAPQRGLTTIGFADHAWDEHIECGVEWYKPQTMKRILDTYDDIKKLSSDKVRVLVGCETEYDYKHRGPAITAETASKLDFVLVPNSHTHLAMPKDFYDNVSKHAAFMLDAWFDIMQGETAKYVTAIPHPFYAVGCPYDYHLAMKAITNKQYEDCFKAAAQMNIGVELNMDCLTEDVPNFHADEEVHRMYSIAKSCGCKFTFGSDAHSIPRQECLKFGDMVTKELGITENDLLVF